MSFSKRLGSRLKAQREELGLTQRQLSDKLAPRVELSEKQISVIERGLSGTTIENFVELCTALEKTPDYFCLGIVRGEQADAISEINENIKLCSEEDIENLRLFSRVLAEKKKSE